MSTNRKERVSLHLKECASSFINQESNRRSMITVTDVSMSNDLKRATIFLSVYPTSQGKAALDFLKRKRTELREHIKHLVNMKTIPHIEVELDQGELHRQKIDRLLESDSSPSLEADGDAR